MRSDFSISVGDDPDHEDLTAEIYFRQEFVGIVSQEQGLDVADIKLFARSSGEPWSFKLQDFVDTLSRARQRLWELRRTSGAD